MVLIAAQVLLEKGEVAEAIKVLESNLPDGVRYSAGVLSAIVSLYLAIEDRPKATNMFISQWVCRDPGMFLGSPCGRPPKTL